MPNRDSRPLCGIAVPLLVLIVFVSLCKALAAQF